MASPDPTSPLREFSVVSSHDPTETHGRATQLLNEHRMRLGDRATDFKADVRVAPVGSLAMLYFSYGAPVEIAPAPLETFVAVHIPLAGRMSISSADGVRVYSPGTASVTCADDRVTMRWSGDFEHLVVRIDHRAIEARVEALTGAAPNRPIEFDRVIGDDGSGRAFVHAVRAMQSSLDDFGARGLPQPLASSYEDLVLGMLLLEHDHDHAEQLASRGRVAVGAATAATDHVRDHVAAAISVADLAAVARVSERALFDAFRREFGCTPMQWVRRFRLERAHAALRAADPRSGVTVADIAAAHGCGHLGRFAADYRDCFGESPSATLRG